MLEQIVPILVIVILVLSLANLVLLILVFLRTQGPDPVTVAEKEAKEDHFRQELVKSIKTVQQDVSNLNADLLTQTNTVNDTVTKQIATLSKDTAETISVQSATLTQTLTQTDKTLQDRIDLFRQELTELTNLPKTINENVTLTFQNTVTKLAEVLEKQVAIQKDQLDKLTQSILDSLSQIKLSLRHISETNESIVNLSATVLEQGTVNLTEKLQSAKQQLDWSQTNLTDLETALRELSDQVNKLRGKSTLPSSSGINTF